MFQVEFGLQLFLTWGTLLGAIREGDLIPHDFDIDVAYVSRARSAAGVTRERKRIFDHFAGFDRIMPGHSPGRFMLRAVRSPSGRFDHGIEVFTGFVTGARFFGYPTLPGTLPSRAIRPFRQATLRGVPFAVPRQAERMLEQCIGADWRIPRLPKDHTDPAGRYACFVFLYPPR
ncbi:LicD family protein [Marinibacterium profundimaris]|nr:LicD family protein [Marinibacterium profundimaris]